MPAARITITLPEALVERIDRLERNRSRFIADAVERELRRRLRAELRRSLEALALPFVEEYRCRFARQSLRVGFEQGTLGRLVEQDRGPGAAARCGRLADALGTLHGDCGEVGHELVELVVDDAWEVRRHDLRYHVALRYATVAQPLTLPFRTSGRAVDAC